MKRPAPVFTNLGMHFVNVSANQVVLVQVEVNVRGLLAVHGRRLCKSKVGKASASSGTVRMTLATPDDREIAHAVAHSPAFINERAAHDAMSENERLLTELTRLRHELIAAERSYHGSTLHQRQRAQADGEAQELSTLSSQPSSAVDPAATR